MRRRDRGPGAVLAGRRWERVPELSRGVRTVRLLRHAMPEQVPGVDPARWVLGPAGLAAASGLRGAVPGGACVLSSPEPKAVATAEAATGVPPRCDPRFAEVRRPLEPFGGEVRARRGAWVAGRLDERHEGWETPAQAAARFAEGVAAYRDDLVVATHGMVMTAWLVVAGHVSPDAAEAFWRELSFPELIVVEVP